MNVSSFLIKWKQSDLTERSGSHQHFCDLCELFDHPKPADADPKGEWFAFEKGAAKHGGGDGWADVWKMDFFAWEYKGKHKDLDAAYDQLLKYREALNNPPLLCVCDMDRIVIHTNFTATPTNVHEIRLLNFQEPDNLEILRAVFHDPNRLKPGQTREAITKEAAERLAKVADRLRGRGLDRHQVARFLDRIVFCLFAEDVGLLPENTLTQVLDEYRYEPEQFTAAVKELFARMAAGGRFGVRRIKHFDGNLFENVEVLTLEYPEIESIWLAGKLDWAAVDASIFGTLFERGMDPDKRGQLGTHYTSRADIETLVEPVVMAPLRREWDECRQTIESLLTTGRKPVHVAQPPSAVVHNEMPLFKGDPQKARHEGEILINRFLQRLSKINVLDPACGSGNFLYVTLQKLKDLEKEAILYAGANGLGDFLPAVGPWQLHGIEINEYAFELAQLTVWIGYLQWLIHNGFGHPAEPILRPMHTFECKDAILDLSDPDHPKEPEWPKVDFIVGNPPFLGDKLMRGELGDEYVSALRAHCAGRLPSAADLCCYWFEKARKHIQEGKCRRAGLLGTQGIRGGANREVLKRIRECGGIFFAESDRAWVLDGATVHISMVGFDGGDEEQVFLNGQPVAAIYPNLSASADTSSAVRLRGLTQIAFIGVSMHGPFDLENALACELLEKPLNPNGKSNSDVVRPVLNAYEIAKRAANRWVVYFPPAFDMRESALYEAPFEYVAHTVKPVREQNNRKAYREHWWLHGEARPAMVAALAPLQRFVATPRVGKHRLFVWISPVVLPSDATVVFARSDDYFLGVLHSRLHEVWARATGTQLRERESGFRYTPTTCFETFPFPHPTPEQEGAIGAAARELNELRENWLNPPEWVKEEVLEFPGTVGGPWTRYIDQRTVDSGQRTVGSGQSAGSPGDKPIIGTVRYPRLVPRDAGCAKRLKKQTLTNLYNQRPTWLALAHKKLDEAVFAAYGWDAGMGDEEILEKLLALNLEGAAGD
ncbi:MAG TPA: DNA methyltransferase [Planctomycetota bacterium]|nr:DNA methyltransferase [Planctomycetota bacterium]